MASMRMLADIRLNLKSYLLYTGSILVLLGLAVTLLLPALDHHAVERFPLHSHALFSGSSDLHSHYLHSHHHGYDGFHSHGEPEPSLKPSSTACVPGAQPAMISTLDLDGIGASIFLRVLLLPTPVLPPPPQDYSELLLGYSLSYSGPILDLLDPPPRFFC